MLDYTVNDSRRCGYGTEKATAIDRHSPEWLQSISMRTQGEIEAAITEGISRFEQDYMARGPKDIPVWMEQDNQ